MDERDIRTWPGPVSSRVPAPVVTFDWQLGEIRDAKCAAKGRGQVARTGRVRQAPAQRHATAP